MGGKTQQCTSQYMGKAWVGKNAWFLGCKQTCLQLRLRWAPPIDLGTVAIAVCFAQGFADGWNPEWLSKLKHQPNQSFPHIRKMRSCDIGICSYMGFWSVPTIVQLLWHPHCSLHSLSHACCSNSSQTVLFFRNFWASMVFPWRVPQHALQSELPGNLHIIDLYFHICPGLSKLNADSNGRT